MIAIPYDSHPPYRYKVLSGVTAAISLITILSLCIFTGASTQAATSSTREDTSESAVPNGWTQVWGDEFDGTSLDSSKWDVIPADWQAEQTSSDSDHVFLQDGVLHLKTTLSDDGTIVRPSAISTVASNNQKLVRYRNYTHMAWRYGYAEIRVKTDTSGGAWPAWWMTGDTNLPDRQEQNGMGEIDIMEVWPQSGKQRPALHKWAYPGGGEYTRGKSLTEGNAMNAVPQNKWTTYGVKWTPTTLTFYVNGHQTASVGITDKNDFGTDIQGNTDKMAMFRDPMYMILNGGAASEQKYIDTSKIPFDFQIDWIRIWQNTKDSKQKLYTTDQSTIASAKTKITFKANGGAESDKTISLDKGETLTFPSSEFSRFGFVLKEWNTSKDGKGISVKPGTTSPTTLTGDYTFYAIWAPSPISVFCIAIIAIAGIATIHRVHKHRRKILHAHHAASL